jgi:hypothetical protein
VGTEENAHLDENTSALNFFPNTNDQSVGGMQQSLYGKKDEGVGQSALSYNLESSPENNLEEGKSNEGTDATSGPIGLYRKKKKETDVNNIKDWSESELYQNVLSCYLREYMDGQN